MPPCILPCICLPGRYPRYVHTLYHTLCTHQVHTPISPSRHSFPFHCWVLGSRSRKRGSFTSGINPLPRGNLSGMLKKPATESPLAQGGRESPNPSGNDLPPPSRLQHADNGERGTSRCPGSQPLFLLKVDKSVETWDGRMEQF